MTAEKMFDNLGYTKRIRPVEIEYRILSSNGIDYNFICFDLKEKKSYILCSCEEEDTCTVFEIDNKIINAINKQLEELGWLEKN